ncbi:type VI secretion system protein TssA [Cupriavidus agavae]|uniref:Type VI secretion system protein VasJ n=1 Tax=Cupriavidus agavae TaxID=1001822 RepID=A0A4Q7RCI7_9BURK|nr:type VI secretion system protein TssA [Cupriavidus agavae]RZT30865.1 type VI secretion system protein VasJ [Cupriavidus agavae]
MFQKLLKALFGGHSPSALARAGHARWEPWLQPIRADAPVGSDPAYDDDFLAVKDEVAKLSDVDDARIIDLSQRLLRSTAKDARVAAYYAYGRMRRDVAEGVAEAFELLSALVERFGEQLLPARPERRKAALEWLAGDTFTGRLDRVSGLSGKPLERTLSALALIQECTAKWPETARPALDGLFRLFQGRIEAPSAGDRESQTAPGPAAASALDGGEVGSARELLDRARQMAQFLQEQPDGYLAACRVMRCVRWDTLAEVPPHDASGRTRLLAPRGELRAQLRRLLLRKQWPELLDRVEQAFAEGANHFWLDLQYYAFVAQEHAGSHHAQARSLMATDCALMLERLPGLEQLAYADGTPFADDATRDWIARHATVRDMERGEPLMPVPLDAAGADWTEAEAQAADIAGQQGLELALAWLQDLPARGGERERFMRQMAMARVAERAGRGDTAVQLLNALDQRARQFQLAEWEPALAFEVKQQLLRLLKARHARKDADKAVLGQRMETLLAELTAIDPPRAVALA